MGVGNFNCECFMKCWICLFTNCHPWCNPMFTYVHRCNPVLFELFFTFLHLSSTFLVFPELSSCLNVFLTFSLFPYCSSIFSSLFIDFPWCFLDFLQFSSIFFNVPRFSSIFLDFLHQFSSIFFNVPRFSSIFLDFLQFSLNFLQFSSIFFNFPWFSSIFLGFLQFLLNFQIFPAFPDFGWIWGFWVLMVPFAGGVYAE